MRYRPPTTIYVPTRFQHELAIKTSLNVKKIFIIMDNEMNGYSFVMYCKDLSKPYSTLDIPEGEVKGQSIFCPEC